MPKNDTFTYKIIKKDEIQTVVRKTISTTALVSDFKNDDNLITDMGLDPMDCLITVMQCEKYFGINFSNDDIKSIRTVNDIINLIYTKQPKRLVQKQNAITKFLNTKLNIKRKIDAVHTK